MAPGREAGKSSVKRFIQRGSTECSPNEVKYAKERGAIVRWFSQDPVGDRVKEIIRQFIEKQDVKSEV